MGIEEIKTIPSVLLSHPFVERAIGTVRREFLDPVLFWNEIDLPRKLEQYQRFYNEIRGHLALNSERPCQVDHKTLCRANPVKNYHWVSHCNGLFNTPVIC